MRETHSIALSALEPLQGLRRSLKGLGTLVRSGGYTQDGKGVGVGTEGSTAIAFTALSLPPRQEPASQQQLGDRAAAAAASIPDAV